MRRLRKGERVTCIAENTGYRGHVGTVCKHDSDGFYYVRWDGVPEYLGPCKYGPTVLARVCPYCQQPVSKHLARDGGFKCLFGSTVWRP